MYPIRGRILSTILGLTGLVLLAGCGVSSRGVSGGAGGSNGGNRGAPVMMSVNSYNEAKASLKQAYRDWKGTPYILGGASQSGVDCSSFIQIVFDDYFGIDLPGHTRRLLRSGDGIRRASLRTGDLVFFKTGRGTMHAGIVVEGKRFMHASTSSGVMMSSLNERYWATRYLGARRVM